MVIIREETALDFHRGLQEIAKALTQLGGDVPMNREEVALMAQTIGTVYALDAAIVALIKSSPCQEENDVHDPTI